MSLPPTMQWVYNQHPAENSEEAKLLEVLANPKKLGLTPRWLP